jgi:uncharacterized protein YciI
LRETINSEKTGQETEESRQGHAEALEEFSAEGQLATVSS